MEDANGEEARLQADPHANYILRFKGLAGGAGAVLLKESSDREWDDLPEKVGQIRVDEGVASQHAAGYMAVNTGMQAALAIGVRKLRVEGDFQLVVEQVAGRWATNVPALARLNRSAQRLKRAFTSFEINLISKNDNADAKQQAEAAQDYGGWEGMMTNEGEVSIGNLEELLKAAEQGARSASSGPQRHGPGILHKLEKKGKVGTQQLKGPLEEAWERTAERIRQTKQVELAEAEEQERRSEMVNEEVSKGEKEMAEGGAESGAGASTASEALGIDPGRTYILYFDGACQGNGTPTPRSSVGCILYEETGGKDGRIVWELASKLNSNRVTNNVAEYSGLICGLEAAHRCGVLKLKVFGDSKLVVEQMAGRWKIRHPNIKVIFPLAEALMHCFKEFTIKHVRREYNEAADGLANLALKGRGFRGVQTEEGLVDAGVPAKLRELHDDVFPRLGSSGDSGDLPYEEARPAQPVSRSITLSPSDQERTRRIIKGEEPEVAGHDDQEEAADSEGEEEEEEGGTLTSAADMLDLDPNKTYLLCFDGARQGLGSASQKSLGCILYEEGTEDEEHQVIWEMAAKLESPRVTINIAKFCAFICGLEAALQSGVLKLRVSGDSKMVVEQMNGERDKMYSNFMTLYPMARGLMDAFEECTVTHIAKKENKVADGLANLALEKGGWKGVQTEQGLVDAGMAEKLRELHKDAFPQLRARRAENRGTNKLGTGGQISEGHESMHTAEGVEGTGSLEGPLAAVEQTGESDRSGLHPSLRSLGAEQLTSEEDEAGRGSTKNDVGDASGSQAEGTGAALAGAAGKLRVSPQSTYYLACETKRRDTDPLALRSGVSCLLYEEPPGFPQRWDDDEPWELAARFGGPAVTREVAEYCGLILGMEAARNLGVHKLLIHIESWLVMHLMDWKKRVTDPDYQILNPIAQALMREFNKCTTTLAYRRRDEEDEADKLALKGQKSFTGLKTEHGLIDAGVQAKLKELQDDVFPRLKTPSFFKSWSAKGNREEAIENVKLDAKEKARLAAQQARQAAQKKARLAAKEEARQKAAKKSRKAKAKKMRKQRKAMALSTPCSLAWPEGNVFGGVGTWQNGGRLRREAPQLRPAVGRVMQGRSLPKVAPVLCSLQATGLGRIFL